MPVSTYSTSHSQASATAEPKPPAPAKMSRKMRELPEGLWTGGRPRMASGLACSSTTRSRSPKLSATSTGSARLNSAVTSSCPELVFTIPKPSSEASVANT